MSTVGIFGFLCGSAVMLTFFLAVYFIVARKEESIRFLWLGFIFLAIGLRLGKSIVFFIINDMAPFGLALGFMGLATIGPMVWLHTRDRVTFKAQSVLPHLIIPMTGAMFCFLVSPSPWETRAYIIGTAILGIYLALSWMYHLGRKDEAKGLRNWKTSVLVLATGVWASFVYQHLTATMMQYAYGSLIASAFIYWIFFKSLKTQLNLSVRNLSIPDHILRKIKMAFEEENIFKQQSITLNDFSNSMDIPPYLVTKGVKKLYGRTFPEALNHFRVETIKNLLANDDYRHLKIESLAYDAGFASPSSFYAAFKKATGSSPTEYLKSRELKSA